MENRLDFIRLKIKINCFQTSLYEAYTVHIKTHRDQKKEADFDFRIFIFQYINSYKYSTSDY